MNIEIYEIQGFLSEKTTLNTCFYAEDYIKKALRLGRTINGIVIIDNKHIKFCFSPMGMDGDIFTDDPSHRTIIKSIIPTWYYTKFVKKES